MNGMINIAEKQGTNVMYVNEHYRNNKYKYITNMYVSLHKHTYTTHTQNSGQHRLYSSFHL